MIQTDEDALICDFAQVYHIFDYKALPLRMRATLAVGLGNDTRIKKKITNQKFSLSEYLEISILDKLNFLIWMNSKDGQKGINKPKSILTILEGNPKTKGFTTGEDFEKERQNIINKYKKGGGTNG